MDLMTRLANSDLALPILQPHAPQLLEPAARLAAVDVLRAWRRTWAKPAQQHREYLELYFRAAGQTASGRPMQRGIHGVACRPGAAADLHAYPHRIDLREITFCFERLPQDHALPQLSLLLGEHGCAAALPVAAREVLGGAPTDAGLVSFRPGQRAVLRVSRGERSVYAKVFSDHRAVVLAGRLEELQATCLRQEDAPALPRLLGLDRDRRTLWLAELPGRHAGDCLRSEHGASWVGRVLARSLARWHRLAPPAGLTQTARGQWLLEGERKLRKLAVSAPELAAQASELCLRLQKRAPRRDHTALQLIHGDVHPQQFLIDNARRVGICDLDEIALGDPERDLAQSIERIGEHEFLETWQRHASRPLNAGLLRWYLALAHVDRAYRELSSRGQLAADDARRALARAREVLP